MTDYRTTHLDIIIPTLGKKTYLITVINQLRTFSLIHDDLFVRIFVSFNLTQSNRSVVTLETAESRSNDRFQVFRIGPDSYQTSSETHLLWCLDWYRTTQPRETAYLWVLTDNDPIVPAGFAALIEFLGKNEPDVFYANNLWGDTEGEPLTSPAFRVNQAVWHGPAALFFLAVGFEHAPSTIGTFFIRSGFLTDDIVDLYRQALARSEICCHAWWMFEAGTRTKQFYFLATPIVVNKFTAHNFDNAKTWKEATRKAGIPTRYPWTVGYLRHLATYLRQGLLTPQQLRTSVLSEPQRGVLLFLDDILRQLFEQARLALASRYERFNNMDCNVITEVFEAVYPLRMPMIEALCDVLNASNTSPVRRLLSFKTALKFRKCEQRHGIFSPVFRNASNGYFIFEHNLGFVGILRKDDETFAFRDVDPRDVSPLIFYASTEQELRTKIEKARGSVDPQMLIESSVYPTIYLQRPFKPALAFPRIQLWLLSKHPLVWIILLLPRNAVRTALKTLRMSLSKLR